MDKHYTQPSIIGLKNTLPKCENQCNANDKISSIHEVLRLRGGSDVEDIEMKEPNTKIDDHDVNELEVSMENISFSVSGSDNETERKKGNNSSRGTFSLGELYCMTKMYI